MKMSRNLFGSSAEAIVYPLLLLAVMWTMWAFQLQTAGGLTDWGARPQDLSSWKGVFMMPLLHDVSSFNHILNNSFPIFILLAALVYYYRAIAASVFIVSWLGTGLSVWLLAPESNGYHVGMSGVIYALFGFLFLSGFLRNFRPLQVLSLFVLFIYGSMIWGIFPSHERISWEGHGSGMIIGMALAVFYRKLGPQRPKYQFEIEKELGIEPPDLEGQWIARQEALQRMQDELEERQQQQIHIVYHVRPQDDLPKEKRLQDETDRQSTSNPE
jgi:membrane associated rhomboid family serine protease